MSDSRPQATETPIPIAERRKTARFEAVGSQIPLHLRVMLAHAVASLVLLFAAVILFHTIALRTEVNGLEGRFRGTAAAIAGIVDTRAMAVDDVRHARLMHGLEAVADRDASVVDIELLERKADGFVVVAALRPGRVGEAYATTPLLEKALHQASFEVQSGVPIAAAPLVDADGGVIGVARIEGDAALAASARSRVNRLTAGLLLLALGLVGLLTWAIARSLPQPTVRRSTPRIEPDPVSQDLAVVGKRWDVLVKSLMEREFVRDTFGRYVSERVATSIVEGHDGLLAPGESREVVLVYVDVAGAGDRLRRLEPFAAMRWLNEVIVEMSTLIEASGGTVVEVHGDGLLAVFGAPVATRTMVNDAIRAADAMTHRYKALSREWERSGAPAGGHIRIAVHSGPVIAGHVGSANRMHYTVIGDTVAEVMGLWAFAREIDSDRLCSDVVRRACTLSGVRLVGQRALTVGGAPVPVWFW